MLLQAKRCDDLDFVVRIIVHFGDEDRAGDFFLRGAAENFDREKPRTAKAVIRRCQRETAGTATHARGTVALFAVTPTSLMLTLTPPASSPLSPDTFTVPIRSGAVTATTLVLPPQ